MGETANRRGKYENQTQKSQIANESTVNLVSNSQM